MSIVASETETRITRLHDTLKTARHALMSICVRQVVDPTRLHGYNYFAEISIVVLHFRHRLPSATADATGADARYEAIPDDDEAIPESVVCFNAECARGRRECKTNEPSTTMDAVRSCRLHGRCTIYEVDVQWFRSSAATAAVAAAAAAAAARSCVGEVSI